MSERKVLNKYYPPDFDPTKIPKIKRPKNYRKGVFSIRLMAPFNMRCNTCGEYIYKGKKFNSRKETVENENYLGLHIFRFYIKCPRCIAEIAFKTDPVSTDYVLEAGATRNFEATRTAEKMALQEQKEKEAEEANNPMKVLENRTKASCQEMEMLETLEELRELRQKHAKVDTEMMLQQNLEESRKHQEEIKKRQEEEDEQFVRSIFGSDGTGIIVKRLQSDSEESYSSDDSSSTADEPKAKVSCMSMADEKPTNILTQNGPPSSTVPKLQPSWSRSVGSMSSKALLSGLVKVKAASKVETTASPPDSTAKQPCTAVTVTESRAESARTGPSLTTAGRPDDRSNAEKSGSETTVVKKLPANPVAASAVSVGSSALAGLGAYSDSSEGDD